MANLAWLFTKSRKINTFQMQAHPHHFGQLNLYLLWPEEFLDVIGKLKGCHSCIHDNWVWMRNSNSLIPPSPKTISIHVIINCSVAEKNWEIIQQSFVSELVIRPSFINNLQSYNSTRDTGVTCTLNFFPPFSLSCNIVLETKFWTEIWQNLENPLYVQSSLYWCLWHYTCNYNFFFSIWHFFFNLFWMICILSGFIIVPCASFRFLVTWRLHIPLLYWLPIDLLHGVINSFQYSMITCVGTRVWENRYTTYPLISVTECITYLVWDQKGSVRFIPGEPQ